MQLQTDTEITESLINKPLKATWNQCETSVVGRTAFGTLVLVRSVNGTRFRTLLGIYRSFQTICSCDTRRWCGTCRRLVIAKNAARCWRGSLVSRLKQAVLGSYSMHQMLAQDSQHTCAPLARWLEEWHSARAIVLDGDRCSVRGTCSRHYED